ncbi:hypothetical protein ACF1BQ_008625 [Bradyrhizobium sp. RDT10]
MKMKSISLVAAPAFASTAALAQGKVRELRRRGQDGLCHFSWRNCEEATAGKERFPDGKIMQSCR